jgi:hypothetical protein
MRGSKPGRGRKIFPRTCRPIPTPPYSEGIGFYFSRLKQLRCDKTKRKSVAVKRACCEENEEYFSKWKQECAIDLNNRFEIL